MKFTYQWNLEERSRALFCHHSSPGVPWELSRTQFLNQICGEDIFKRPHPPALSLLKLHHDLENKPKLGPWRMSLCGVAELTLLCSAIPDQPAPSLLPVIICGSPDVIIKATARISRTSQATIGLRENINSALQKHYIPRQLVTQNLCINT